MPLIFTGEIISADSRQVYRGMDIGTGKDLSEFRMIDGEIIPYHLIDIIDPERNLMFLNFRKDFMKYSTRCMKNKSYRSWSAAPVFIWNPC